MKWLLPLALALSLTLSAAQAGRARFARQPQPGLQGPELVQRLAAMSPEDRESALSALPPARRANLEERLQAFLALPPAQQKSMRERAAKLAALPPERQAEVRASLRDFNDVPQERRAAIRREVRRTQDMTDDSCEAYMNSHGFRAQFSAAERKMIRDLRAVAPSEPGPPPTGLGR